MWERYSVILWLIITKFVMGHEGRGTGKVSFLINEANPNNIVKNNSEKLTIFVPVGKIHPNRHKDLAQQLAARGQWNNGIYNKPFNHRGDIKPIVVDAYSTILDDLDTSWPIKSSQAKHDSNYNAKFLDNEYKHQGIGDNFMKGYVKGTERCRCSLRQVLMGTCPCFEKSQASRDNLEKSNTCECSLREIISGRCSCALSKLSMLNVKRQIRCGCSLREILSNKCSCSEQSSQLEDLDKLKRCKCTLRDFLSQRCSCSGSRKPGKKKPKRGGCSKESNRCGCPLRDVSSDRCSCSSSIHQTRNSELETDSIKNKNSISFDGDFINGDLGATSNEITDKIKNRIQNLVDRYLESPTDDLESLRQQQSGEVSIPIEKFIDYIARLKEKVVDNVVGFINLPDPGDPEHDISFLTASQQQQLQHLQKDHRDMDDEELRSAVRHILFGSLIGSHSIEKELPAMGYHFRDNKIGPTNILNHLQSLLNKRRQMPLMSKQTKDSLDTTYKTTTKPNPQNLRRYGVPFELNIEGLGQLNA